MKTIITTVGTSLFENYNNKKVEDVLGKNKYTPIHTEYEELRDNRKNASEYDNEGGEEEKITKTINNLWLKGITKKDKKWTLQEGLNKYACAEIESILAIIAENPSQDFDVYLLTTDTVLSVLSAQLIKNWFDDYKNNNITIYFNKKQDIIEYLQIDNINNFKQGLINLNTRYYQIAGNNILSEQFSDVILNVTGGYKGIIPYLTILGQVNKSQIKYIFENTGVLITIPQIPIQLNEEIFEKHWEILSKIENEILNKNDHYQLVTDLESCFEIDIQGNFMFNYLGDALWNRYKSNFFIFYASDDVWDGIQNQSDIQRILSTIFCYQNQRDTHIIWEDTHKVYKKYSDTKRIYFFEDNQKIFIYKTFENESDYKEHHNYFKNNQFNDSLKEKIIQNTKPRKMKFVK